MIPLFTDAEFQAAKSRQLLPLKCKYCDKTFMKTKHHIQDFMRTNKQDTGDYCSLKCAKTNHRIGCHYIVFCQNCGKKFRRQLSQFRAVKNHFCGQSCAAKWNNTHKTHGYRRSKMEVWLEEQLRSLYPTLDFDFNKTSAIDAELDIYIPSLKLAFELNGIFHYEPIYGDKKLASMQTNDKRKFAACIERGISLCVLDVSSVKYFKPANVQKYLDIIINIINQALAAAK